MLGSLARTGLPVLAWAGVIFAFSAVPDLGTGLGGWDLVLRKIAHTAEYAILGALLVRATGRTGVAFALGVLYAVSDEIHQTFVAGRHGSPLDVAIDAVGVAWASRCGSPFGHGASRDHHGPLAIELEALGDTRPLWSAWLESVRSVLAIEPSSLPEDRGAAADALDEAGAGNWRTLLERFAEDHAPAYLRRDAPTSAALQSLASSGIAMGVFTDAPEPSHGSPWHSSARRAGCRVVESGTGALDRVVAALGPATVVVRTRNDLLRRP